MKTKTTKYKKPTLIQAAVKIKHSVRVIYE